MDAGPSAHIAGMPALNAPPVNLELDRIRKNLEAAKAAAVTIQGDAEDAAYVRALEKVADDSALLLRALTVVDSMAFAWQARGEHDMEFSKSIQDENIAESLHTDGADAVERARRIQYAVNRALDASTMAAGNAS